MNHFTDAEIAALNQLEYKPDEPACFDPMRWALRWRDEEYPCGGDEYHHLLDLAVARSFIHQGKPREQWFAIAPTSYYMEVWDEALARAPNWPGFKRVELSDADRQYLLYEYARPDEHF